MKLSFFLGVLMSLASLNSWCQSIAPSLFRPFDVVRAENGEVKVYFVEDKNNKSSFVIRSCGSDFPSSGSRATCTQDESRLSLDLFRRILISNFLIVDANKLLPFTENEILSYRAFDDISYKELLNQKRALEIERTRIIDYINTFGEEPSARARLNEVEQELREIENKLVIAKNGEIAKRKIIKYVDGLVITLKRTKVIFFSKAKNDQEATFNLLGNLDASRGECGTEDVMGRDKPLSIDLRVQNCAELPKSSKYFDGESEQFRWDLVSRRRDASTGQFTEVWRDNKTSFVWGDKLASTYTHDNALSYNTDDSVKKEIACLSDAGKSANAHIREKSFGIPSIEEFRLAEQHGLSSILPNVEQNVFWSSTIHPEFNSYAFVFNSSDEDESLRDTEHSVRCVAR